MGFRAFELVYESLDRNLMWSGFAAWVGNLGIGDRYVYVCV